MANILIVDDDMDFASAVVTVLAKDGHDVQVQSRIDGALKRMRADPPDLVILDVMFPGDNSAGFDLARTMRGDPKLSSVPVLMLTAVNAKFATGFSASDIVDDWMPVSSFLEKPVDLGVLHGRVGSMLSAPGAGAAP
jgi:DNA-binding response OmpR family regulator